MALALQNTMTLRYFATQISALETFGYPADRALRLLGLSQTQLNHPTKRISLHSVETVFRDAATTLGDPWVSLRVGYNFRVPNYAQTGIMYGYCRDLSQVMDLNIKYQKLAIDAAQISHDIEDDRHYFSMTPYDVPHNLPNVLLMIMGAYASSFQWLSWTTGKEIKGAYFDFPMTQNVSVFEDIFRCPVHFGQNKMRLEFYEDTIATPLSTANPEKLALAISKLDALLKSQNATNSFRRAVQSSINAALDMGHISLDIVAKRLNLTGRQLRQKLKSYELSYRELLEAERQALFERRYAQGESFSAISQYLGYNDQAAFNRAFKRWYDMSPSQYGKMVDAER